MQDIQDIIFQLTIGMNREEFKRKCGLMQNPEGLEKPGYCPICKKKLEQNDKGDLFCQGYIAKESSCYWHRYADGLNYWSSPDEMFASMAKTDPEFKKFYNQEIKSNAKTKQ